MARKKITGVYLDPKTKKYYVNSKITHESLDKPIYISKRGFDSATIAREYLDERREEFFNNVDKYSSKNSEFSLFLAIEDYLEYYQTKNKASTTQSRKITINAHIVNYFKDDIPLKDLSVPIIKGWRRSILEKELKPKVVNNVLKLMEKILKRATLRGAIFSQEIFLDLDSVNTSSVEVKKKLEFYTLDEFNKFIKVVEDRWKYFFYVLFFTGVRCGECRALMWRDFDFNNKRLTIERQANNKTGAGTDQITTLKTMSAYRTIPLPENLIDVLLEYKKESKGQYLFFEDRPITPSTIERQTKKYMKLAKIKVIRIHDFRHSFASMCIHLGANPNTLATIMGHASAKETLDTYADMYPNEDLIISQKINEMMIEKMIEKQELKLNKNEQQ